MSEWIEWKGGPRPHDPRTEVEVQFRSGRQEKGLSAFCRWWHEGDAEDICWFRVLSAHPKPNQTEDAA